jgi:hypothetical protein
VVTRIHGLDSAQSVRFSSVPPLEVRTLAQAPVEASNVSLSSAVRALADAAAQRLPSTTALHVFDLLTADDRRMLASTSDLARAHGFALEDLSKLVVDLIAYRDQQLAAGELGSSLSAALKSAAQRGDPERSAPARPASAAETPALPLSLLSFSARDEALARSILSSMALRDTLIDHDFVRALLDPDRLATHAVDFAFLQRVVVALSPAHADTAVAVEISFARRNARARLSDALSLLGFTTHDLSRFVSEAAEHGAQLLHRRVSRVLFGADSAARTFAVLTTLTRNDRSLLGLLYVASRARRVDLALVDDVARALLSFREVERAPVERGNAARNSLRPDAAHAAARAGLLPAATSSSSESWQDSVPPGERLSQAPAARRFGSVSQLAARMVGSYRSLAPVSLSPAPVVTRPFNLVEALGLGSSISELYRKLLRRRRPRRGRLWRSATTLRARRRRTGQEPTLEALLRR